MINAVAIGRSLLHPLTDQLRSLGHSSKLKFFKIMNSKLEFFSTTKSYAASKWEAQDQETIDRLILGSKGSCGLMLGLVESNCEYALL